MPRLCANLGEHQREQLKRLGVNGDWDHYLTMDFQAEATIVAELLKFASSGQLYRGAKPVMWSPVERRRWPRPRWSMRTSSPPRSTWRLNWWRCPAAPELVGTKVVIWTTTPWTIPVNQALAYGPSIDYSQILVGGQKYLVAEPLVDAS
jgi:isoleucyl-tRNA synthetase